MKNIHSTDYIVIGSGIAGLSIANHLVTHGNVLLLTKDSINESSTYSAQGGIAVVKSSGDSFKSHINDTLIAGKGLCNKENVKVLVAEGPSRINDLINSGLKFSTDTNNNLDYTKEAAHSCRRILHVKDETGAYIFNTLLSNLDPFTNIKILNKSLVIKLIVMDNICYGCIFIKDNIIHYVTATSTILATGGSSQVYQFTTNPIVSNGDGIYLAFESGATVTDMEFVQFHPTSLYNPKRQISSLVSESVRGEGGRLVNQDGYYFMKDYDPQGDLASRDIVSRAIFDQMNRLNQKVFLDMSLIGPRFKNRFPAIFKICQNNKLTPPNDLIPISPAAHYLMGGIKTTIDGETSINRLFAIGEVSSLGLHGANLLASNSLLDGLVVSYRAAQKILSLKSLTIPTINPLNFTSDSSLSNDTPRISTIKNIMWQHVGIERHHKGLTTAVNLLRKLPIADNLCPFSFSYRSLRCNAQLTTLFSYHRKESRGAHYRTDYPNTASLFKAHFTFNKNMKKPKLEPIISN